MATLAELLRQGADRLVNLPSEAQRFITNPQAFTQLVTGKNPMPRETGFAAGATGLPAQEISVLDPNQAPYMQGYSQGEPIGYAGMAAPFAAPAAVATAKALAPKAGMMAENYMARQGMMPSIVPQGVDNAITSAERMTIAQRNAALPISEGGLGLAPNNTQWQRAEAMGFNVREPMYHGTKADFAEFSLGKHGSATDKGDFGEAVYVSTDPEIANTYARDAGDYTSGQVMPLYVKEGKRLVTQGQNEFNKLIERLGGEDAWYELTQNPKKYAEAIKDLGYDSVRDMGYYQSAIFDPKNIRSKFAAFDPKQANNPNLLAGGVAVPLVDEDNRKAMLEKLFNSQ
jgi:hypothetical protein